MKKYLMEGLGTFCLGLVLLMSAGSGGANSLAPFTLGAMLVALMYSARPVSGAHFNPAISLAVLIQGKLHRRDIFYYCLAQLAGGVLAVFIAGFLLHCGGAPEITTRGNDPFCALIAEFIGVFVLAFVFLQTTTHDSDTSQMQPALAVGFALAALTALFAGISGAVFNPALALAMILSGFGAWGDFWLYLVSALLGAVAAVSVWRMVQEEAA